MKTIVKTKSKFSISLDGTIILIVFFEFWLLERTVWFLMCFSWWLLQPRSTSIWLQVNYV